MRNLNLAIIGQIGAGKTQMVKRLLGRASRVVVLDPLCDYEEGTVIESFEEAARFWVQHRRDKKFTLIFRGRAGVSFSDDANALTPFRYLLRLIAHSQRVDKLPPLALILEESTFYAERNNPWNEVKAIYLYGRRWKINTISVAQSDVDISTQVRRNSQAIIALRNVKPSADFARYFGDDLNRMAELEKVLPTSKPQNGKHYLTYPPGMDVLREWEEINRV